MSLLHCVEQRSLLAGVCLTALFTYTADSRYIESALFMHSNLLQYIRLMDINMDLNVGWVHVMKGNLVMYKSAPIVSLTAVLDASYYCYSKAATLIALCATCRRCTAINIRLDVLTCRAYNSPPHGHTQRIKLSKSPPLDQLVVPLNLSLTNDVGLEDYYSEYEVVQIVMLYAREERGEKEQKLIYNSNKGLLVGYDYH